MKKFVLFGLLAVFLSGCVTTVKVNKVDTESGKKVNGLRYSLPATYMVVEPDSKTRGGYTVEPKFLPDHEQTYAINAATYLGTLGFDATVENGLLSTITLNQDTSALAAEAIKAAGEVAKAEIDAKAKEEKEAEEKAEEAKKKLGELQDAVAKAEKELEAAKVALRHWQKLSDDSKEPNATFESNRIAAEVAKAQAEFDLQQAEAKLEAFQNSADALLLDHSNTSAILDNPDQNSNGAGETKTPWDHVYGPVYYRLVDNCDAWGKLDKLKTCTVKLEPVKWTCKPGKDCSKSSEPQQMRFPVSTVPPESPTTPPTPGPTFTETTPEPIPVVFKNGLYERHIDLTGKICKEKKVTLKKRETDGNWSDGSYLPIAGVGYSVKDKKAFVLSIRENTLESGIYQFFVIFNWGKECKDEGNGQFLFEIQ